MTRSNRFARMVPLALLLLLPACGPGNAEAAADGALQLRCPYESRMVCTEEGCQHTDPHGSYLMVAPVEQLRDRIEQGRPIQVQRCDDRECTALDITSAASEGFITLSALHGAYMVKIYAGPAIDNFAINPGDFTEVVTSMMTTFVGYGRCEAS